MIRRLLKQLPVISRIVRQRDRLWADRAYDPDLVPTPAMIAKQGVKSLEGWYRWAEEWSMLLRLLGGMRTDSHVLEIGCGLGRIPFALRHILEPGSGTYHGFDIAREKVQFAQRTLGSKYPNFHFTWADLNNTYYNPTRGPRPTDYRFPHEDATIDLVFAASVFTHMLPDATSHYFRESGRVLRPGGRCVFSFFLLDHYVAGTPRPALFQSKDFDFDHRHADYGSDFAMSHPDNQEKMTAYRLSFVDRMAADAGLRRVGEPVRGMWSGGSKNWIAMQDIVTLQRLKG